MPRSADEQRQPFFQLRAALGVFAVVLGLWVIASQALAMVDEQAAPASTSSDGLELSDDDGAAAMFNMGGLSPGANGAGCITVSHTGTQSPSTVRLYGLASGTGLARSLDLTIEVGSGGRFNDCSGFIGSVLYKGTLAEFTAAHRDVGSGLSAFSASGPTGTKSFRFSFGLRDDPAAQGRAAAATFTWENQPSSADPDPAAPPQAEPRETRVEMPTPGRTPLDPAIPESSVPVPSARVPAGPGAPSTETGQSQSPPTGPSSSQSTIPSQAPGGQSPERGLGTPRPLRAVPASPSGRPVGQSTLPRLGRVAVAAAKTTAFPLALLTITIVFLAVQDRIDRRDRS
jgi:hypothetical protein